jgi:hypothetical protein
MHLDVIGQDRGVDVPRCCQSKWYPSTVTSLVIDRHRLIDVLLVRGSMRSVMRSDITVP